MRRKKYLCFGVRQCSKIGKKSPMIFSKHKHDIRFKVDFLAPLSIAIISLMLGILKYDYDYTGNFQT